MTNSIRTMVDMASVLGDERLEFVLDHCLYEGLVEVGRLMQCAESLGGAGRRRTRVLKDLLRVRGEGLAVPLTVLERQFLKVVRSGGMDSRRSRSSLNRIRPRPGAWTSSIPSTRSSSRSMVVAGTRDDSKPEATDTGTT
jgi:hypothetical protein